MKKILMPFMLLLAIVVISISSCTPEEIIIVEPEVDMTGLYTGNVNTNSALEILYVPVLDLDTSFTTLDATAEITEHDSEDPLNIELKMTLKNRPSMS